MVFNRLINIFRENVNFDLGSEKIEQLLKQFSFLREKNILISVRVRGSLVHLQRVGNFPWRALDRE